MYTLGKNSYIIIVIILCHKLNNEREITQRWVRYVCTVHISQVLSDISLHAFSGEAAVTYTRLD